MAGGEQRETVDVAIVGGGLSGLSAARRLRAAGRSVAVLEARERVGGKMRTDHVAGHHADLGAHWIGPTQDRIAALAREFGVRTRAAAPGGTRGAGGPRAATHVSRLHPPAVATGDRGARHRSATTRPAAQRVPVEHPWVLAPVTDWDSQTVDSFARRQLRTAGARLFLDLATELVFGAEPEELSLLYFLFYLQSGRRAHLADRVRGGRPAGPLRGRQPAALRPPRRAARRGRATRHTGRRLWSRTASRSCCAPRMAPRSRARHAIVAVSPALAGRWHWARPLPADRDMLAQRMPMGAYMKVVVAYDRAWWRDANLSGIAYADTGPLQMVVDASSGGAAGGLLACFITGRAVERYGRLELGARQAAVRESLTRMFGPPAGELDRHTPSATGPPSPTAAAARWA